jgi:hypothetical protein
LAESLNVLKKHAGYFHEDVRLQAMVGLERMASLLSGYGTCLLGIIVIYLYMVV